MNLPDKVRELYGVAPPAGSGAVGYVPGNASLGIPPLILSEYVSENDHVRLLDQGFGPGGGASRLSMRPTIAHLTIASWVSGSRS